MKISRQKMLCLGKGLWAVGVLLASCGFVVGQARLDKGDCSVSIPDGIKVECFKITVPEDRMAAAGRMISMAVIVVKSTAAKPLPDPIVYTAGGPGAGSLGMVRGAANLAPLTAKRDFIIFEQRGTDKADPSLGCPEVTLAIHEAFGRGSSQKNEIDAEVAAARVCRDRLVKSGVNLSAYNSRESAADLDDLRRLMGIEKWNLYGISYSTRLMVNYARDYPAHVRSIILDSVLPINANWDETGVENIRAAIIRLLSACSQTTDCAAKYPDLERKFYEAVAELDRQPAAFDLTIDGKTRPFKLFGRHFVDLVYNLLEGNGSLQSIPFTIDAVSRKNYEPLKQYADGQLNGSGFIWGMRYSVWCGEEMPFQNKSRIEDSFRANQRLGGFSGQPAISSICSVWKVKDAPKTENERVKIAAPVLAFGGEFDPDTPFAWGQDVSSWSDHGYFFKVPSTTHGAMNRRCTFLDIPIAFLENPTVRPDQSCLSAIPPLAFK